MNKKLKNIFKSSLIGLTLLLCSCHINVLDHNNNNDLKKVRAEEDSNEIISYTSILNSSNIYINFKKNDGTNFLAAQVNDIRENIELSYSNNILTLTYNRNNNLIANGLLNTYGVKISSFTVDLASFDSELVGGQKFSYRVITDPTTLLDQIYYSDYIYSINDSSIGGGSIIMQDGSPSWNYTYTDNVFIEEGNDDDTLKYIEFSFDESISISSTSFKLNLAYICFVDYSQNQYLGSYVSNDNANAMYEDGLKNGISQGKAEGKEETINDLYEGKTYQQIFTEGVLQGERNTQSFGSLLPTLFGSLVNIPISVLNGLAPLTFFDLSIIKVVITLLMLNVILWIIRKVLI